MRLFSVTRVCGSDRVSFGERCRHLEARRAASSVVDRPAKDQGGVYKGLLQPGESARNPEEISFLMMHNNNINNNKYICIAA